MKQIHNWLKSLRRKIFGFSEVEAATIERFAFTNEMIYELRKSTDRLHDRLESLSQSVAEIQESIALLSRPEKLIPQLNAYTGKYYLALEYSPSRKYQL